MPVTVGLLLLGGIALGQVNQPPLLVPDLTGARVINEGETPATVAIDTGITYTAVDPDFSDPVPIVRVDGDPRFYAEDGKVWIHAYHWVDYENEGDRLLTLTLRAVEDKEQGQVTTHEMVVTVGNAVEDIREFRSLGTLSYEYEQQVELYIGRAFVRESTATGESYAATGLPPGFTLDAGSGVIAGTVHSDFDLHPITMTLTDSRGSATSTFTMEFKDTRPGVYSISISGSVRIVPEQTLTQAVNTGLEVKVTELSDRNRVLTLIFSDQRFQIEDSTNRLQYRPGTEIDYENPAHRDPTLTIYVRDGANQRGLTDVGTVTLRTENVYEPAQFIDGGLPGTIWAHDFVDRHVSLDLHPRYVKLDHSVPLSVHVFRLGFFDRWDRSASEIPTATDGILRIPKPNWTTDTGTGDQWTPGFLTVTLDSQWVTVFMIYDPDVGDGYTLADRFYYHNAYLDTDPTVSSVGLLPGLQHFYGLIDGELKLMPVIDPAVLPTGGRITVKEGSYAALEATPAVFTVVGNTSTFTVNFTHRTRVRAFVNGERWDHPYATWNSSVIASDRDGVIDVDTDPALSGLFAVSSRFDGREAMPAGQSGMVTVHYGTAFLDFENPQHREVTVHLDYFSSYKLSDAFRNGHGLEEFHWPGRFKLTFVMLNLTEPPFPKPQPPYPVGRYLENRVDVSDNYIFDFESEPGSRIFNASGMPAGLTLAADGIVGGAPLVAHGPYLVTLTTTDAFGSGTVTITFDVQDYPEFELFSNSPVTITENFRDGRVDDTGARLAFPERPKHVLAPQATILRHGGPDRFWVVGSSMLILPGSSFDYENLADRTITVVVEATEQGTFPSSREGTIIVVLENDPELPEILFNSYTVSLRRHEMVTLDAWPISAVRYDADGGLNRSFPIAPGSAFPALLQYDMTFGTISGSATVSVGLYTVSLQAKDNIGTARFALDLIIDVKENNLPEIRHSSTASVHAEGTFTTPTYTGLTVDVYDADGDALTIHILNDSRFIMHGNSLFIRPQSTFNYEAPGGVDRTISLSIHVIERYFRPTEGTLGVLPPILFTNVLEPPQRQVASHTVYVNDSSRHEYHVEEYEFDAYADPTTRRVTWSEPSAGLSVALLATNTVDLWELGLGVFLDDGQEAGHFTVTVWDNLGTTTDPMLVSVVLDHVKPTVQLWPPDSPPTLKEGSYTVGTTLDYYFDVICGDCDYTAAISFNNRASVHFYLERRNEREHHILLSIEPGGPPFDRETTERATVSINVFYSNKGYTLTHSILEVATLWLDNVEEPPVVHTKARTVSVRLGNTVNISVWTSVAISFDLAGGNSLSYPIAPGAGNAFPDGLLYDPAHGVMGGAAAGPTGVFTVRLLAQDNIGVSNTTLNLIVDIRENQLPTVLNFSPGTPQPEGRYTVTVDVGISVNAFDPDGDELTMHVLDDDRFTFFGNRLHIKVGASFNYEDPVDRTITLRAHVDERYFHPSPGIIVTLPPVLITNVEEPPRLTVDIVTILIAPTVGGTFTVDHYEYDVSAAITSRTFTWAPPSSGLAVEHASSDANQQWRGELSLGLSGVSVGSFTVSVTDEFGPSDRALRVHVRLPDPPVYELQPAGLPTITEGVYPTASLLASGHRLIVTCPDCSYARPRLRDHPYVTMDVLGRFYAYTGDGPGLDREQTGAYEFVVSLTLDYRYAINNNVENELPVEVTFRTGNVRETLELLRHSQTVSVRRNFTVSLDGLNSNLLTPESLYLSWDVARVIPIGWTLIAGAPHKRPSDLALTKDNIGYPVLAGVPTVTVGRYTLFIRPHEASPAAPAATGTFSLIIEVLDNLLPTVNTIHGSIIPQAENSVFTELSPVGISVDATDPDGDELTMVVVDDGRFTMLGHLLHVNTGAFFNYENPAERTIEVSVRIVEKDSVDATGITVSLTALIRNSLEAPRLLVATHTLSFNITAGQFHAPTLYEFDYAAIATSRVFTPSSLVDVVVGTHPITQIRWLGNLDVTLVNNAEAGRFILALEDDYGDADPLHVTVTGSAPVLPTFAVIPDEPLSIMETPNIAGVDIGYSLVAQCGGCVATAFQLEHPLFTFNVLSGNAITGRTDQGVIPVDREEVEFITVGLSLLYQYTTGTTEPPLPHTLTISVINVEEPPLVTHGLERVTMAVLVPGAVDLGTISFAIYDISSNLLSHSLDLATGSSLPAGLTFVPSSGVLSGAPDGPPRTHTIRLHAGDNFGLSPNHATIEIVLQGRSSPPSVTVQVDPAVSLFEGRFAVATDTGISLAADEPVSLALQAGADARFTMDVATVRIRAGTEFDYETPADQSITLVALASSHGEPPRVATITLPPVRIHNVNEAPTLVPPPLPDHLSHQVGEPFSVDVTARFGDPDFGDTLAYALATNPTAGWLAISGGVVSGTPQTLVTLTATVTATDASGTLSVTDDFIIAVVANNSPLLSVTGEQTLTLNEGTLVASDTGYGFTVSDVEDDSNGLAVPVVLSGDDRFELAAMTVRVKDGAEFDYEQDDGRMVTLSLVATDSDAGTATATVVVTVTNVHENPDPDGATGQVPPMAVLAHNTLTTALPDDLFRFDFNHTLGQEVYDVPLEIDWLAVSSSMLVATPVQANTGTVTLLLTVRDISLSVGTRPFTVTVLPDRAPLLAVNTDLIGFGESDEIVSDTPLPGLSITVHEDPDATDVLPVLSLDGDARFQLVGTTGLALKAGSGLDFEDPNDRQIRLTLVSRDGNHAPLATTVYVTVQAVNVNDAAPEVTLLGTQFTLHETVAVVSTGLSVSIHDPDGPLPVVALSGTRFTLGGSTLDAVRPLQFATATRLDYETEPFLTVTLTVSDGANLPAQLVVTVSVHNDNDERPALVVTGPQLALTENAPHVSVGLTVTSSDPDGAGYPLSLALSDPRLRLAGTPGPGVHVLRFDPAYTPDFEAVRQLVVTMTVNDGVQDPVEETVTVTFADANEPPTVKSPLPDRLHHQVSTAFSVAVTGVFGDPDANDVLTYTMSTTPSVNWLGITAGVISGTPLTLVTVTVTVTATDSGGLTATDAFVLGVVANRSPTLSLTGEQTLVLNEGTLAGARHTGHGYTVSDHEDDQANLQVPVAISGDARFELAGTTVQVKSGVTFDFEDPADRTLTLTLTATDSDNATAQVTFQVTVTNVKEPPTTVGATVPVPSMVVLAHNTLRRELPAGLFRYDHSHTIGTHRYTLQSGAPAWLTIDGGTLVATPAQADEGMLAVGLTVFDSNTLSGARPVTVTVLRDHAPVLAVNATSVAVTENVTGNIGVAVTTLADPDVTLGDVAPSLTLVADARFELAGRAVRIKAGAILDHEREEDRELVLSLVGHDGNQPTLATTVAVTVHLLNADDNVATMSVLGTQLPLDENTPHVSTGFTVSLADPDGVLPVVSLSDPRFTLAGPVSVAARALVFSPAYEFDYEQVRGLTLTITATEPSGRMQRATVVLSFGNLNDNAPAATLAGTQVTFPHTQTIAASMGTGFRYEVDDADGDAVTISLSGGLLEAIETTPGGDWTIRFATGHTIDYQAMPSVTATVYAHDGKFTTTIGVLAVTFRFDNSPPQITFLGTQIELRENELLRQTGYTLSISDPDGQPLTISFSDPRLEDEAAKASSGTLTIVVDDLVFELSTTLDYEAEREIVLQVSASDSHGDEAEAFLTLSVTNVREPPVPVGVLTVTLLVNRPVAGITLPGTAVEFRDAEDTGDHTVSVSNLPGNLSVSAAGVLHGTPVSTGSVTTTMTVTNPGGTATAQLVIVVIDQDIHAELEALNKAILPGILGEVGNGIASALSHRGVGAGGPPAKQANGEVIRLLRENAANLEAGRVGLADLLAGREFEFRLEADWLDEWGEDWLEDWTGDLSTDLFTDPPLEVAGDYVFWGRGSASQLAADADGLKWDGDLFQGNFGIETKPDEDVLVGVGLTHASGDFDYVGNLAGAIRREGTTNIAINVFYPYLKADLPDNGQAWGFLGLGKAGIDYKDKVGSNLPYPGLDGDVQFFGAGLNQWLNQERRWRLVGSFVGARLDIDTAGFKQSLSHPMLEVGVEYRHREQDEFVVHAALRSSGGETGGLGYKLGGFIHSRAPNGRSSFSLGGRLNRDGDVHGWGADIQLIANSRQEPLGLGLRLSAGQGLDDGADGLTTGPIGLFGRVATDLGSRREARLEYGLRFANGTLTPYARHLLRSGERTNGLGLRYRYNEYSAGFEMIEKSALPTEYKFDATYEDTWLE